MLITKITRTYSRSINARNYGMPESWIKVEAQYEATCESGDNPIALSQTLYEQCKKDVVTNVDEIVEKIKAANKNLQNNMNPGGSTTIPSNTGAPTVPGATGPRSL